MAKSTATAANRAATWALMRERVRVLVADNKSAMVGYYADSLRTKPEFDTPANHYGYALALLQDRQAEKALTQLQPLLKAQPDSLPLALAVARAELDAGQRTAALARYTELAKRSPDSRPIHLAWAEALLASGDRADARRAQDLLRPLMSESDDSPAVYLVFGRACELAGETVRAAMAHADAAYLSGRAMDALTQLQNLAKRKDLDFYQRARIEARIAEFTPVVLELRHRGVKPGTEGKHLSTQAPLPSYR
jgi:predicted Zn-dependent protease